MTERVEIPVARAQEAAADIWRRTGLVREAGAWCALAVCCVGLWALASQGYLLFHTTVELLAVLVAWVIFLIVWSARRNIDNNAILAIGIACLSVGTFDFLHTLAYKDMNLLTQFSVGSKANLATQLWIAARGIQAVSFVAALVSLRRRLQAEWLLGAYMAVTCVLLGAIFYWQIFPACYLDGTGLTRFKITAEYVIAALLVLALVLLYRERRAFSPGVYGLLSCSMVLTIASELIFTQYLSVFDVWNETGHLLKFAAIFILGRAIVVTGLRTPYDLLFANLKRSEEALRASESALLVRHSIADAFLTVADDEVYAEVMGTVLEALDSPYGMFGLIDEDGALVCPSLTRDVSEKCRMSERQTRFPLEQLDGRIWGRTIRRRLTLCENRPMAVPEGHIAITRALCTPIAFHDSVIGVILVANKASDYGPDDIERLEMIANMTAPILEARLERERQEKQRRLAEEALRKSEEQLRTAHAFLEVKVQERTALLARANADLKQEMAARRQLERRVLDVAEAEQRRFGQDLHDGLGQQLTGIALKSELLAQELNDLRLPHAAEALRIEELVREAIQQTRRLARGLCPINLDAEGLASALKQLAEYTAELFRIRCQFACTSPTCLLNTSSAIHLYRIAQEALNNAIRRGRAKNITITLNCSRMATVLTVQDDGTGYAPDPSGEPGMGIQSMSYRARLIGGIMDIAPGADGGTIVTCRCESARFSMEQSPAV